MTSLSFEKDDDSNGHVDFITASSVSGRYFILIPYMYTTIHVRAHVVSLHAVAELAGADVRH